MNSTPTNQPLSAPSGHAQTTPMNKWSVGTLVLDSSDPSSPRALGFAFLYFIYAIGLSVTFRYFGPPALQLDDGFFFLISYSWLNGLGFNNFWVNPLYGSTVFNWHGFLQPTVVALISPCATLQCVNIGLIALGGFYLVVWYFTANTITSSHTLRWALYLIGVSLVLRYSARPELLASLELVALVLLFHQLPSNRYGFIRALAAGGGVALALVTSPVAGTLAGLGVAATVVYLRRNDREYVGFALEGLLCLVSMLCIFFVMLVFVYPLPALTWLAGIVQYSSRTINRTDYFGFFKNYFMLKNIPLLGLMFFPLGGFAGLALEHMGRVKDYLLLCLFVIFCSAFTYLLYFSAIRIPINHYNFTVLVPSIALITVSSANHCSARGQRYLALAFVAFVLLFSAACLLGQLIWTAQSLNEARDLGRLSDGIASAASRYLSENRRIAMDTPLIGAIDDLEKLKKIDILFMGKDHKLNDDPPEVDVLFRAQNEFGALPNEVPGFKLVVDNFDHSAFAHFLTPKGSYYAVYEAVPRSSK